MGNQTFSLSFFVHSTNDFSSVHSTNDFSSLLIVYRLHAFINSDMIALVRLTTVTVLYVFILIVIFS